MTTRQRIFQALTSPITMQDRLALITFAPTHSLQHVPSDAALHQAQDADLNQLIVNCSAIRAQNC